MSDLGKEAMMVKLEGYIDKIEYLSESIIERYDLDKGAVESQDEALVFAYNRENIGMEIEILHDYIQIIRESVFGLREAVTA